MVTCFSLHRSNKADCTLAGARLISSANTKFAKIGPFFYRKFICFNVINHGSTTSAGNKSGVN
jgi:hypothetical protein